MPTPLPHCQIPSNNFPMPSYGQPDSLVSSAAPPALPNYDALHVDAGVIFGMIVVCIMTAQILYRGHHKAERGASLLVIWAMVCLILGQNALAATLTSCAAGCACAAYSRTPAWLWRAVGNRDGLWMGGAVAAALLSAIAIAYHASIVAADLVTCLTAGAAAALFIAASYNWETDLLRQTRSNVYLVVAAALLCGLSKNQSSALPVAAVIAAAAAARQTKAFMTWWEGYLERKRFPPDGLDNRA